MATHRSALKAHRQSLVRRARNRHYRTMVRKAVKTFRSAVAGSDVEGAQTAFNKAESVIRRVAGKGIMKSKTADRSISRMARSLNSLQSSK